MAFKSVQGGFNLSREDLTVALKQRALTKQVNESFIQVGAVFLKPSGKMPFDEDWWSKNYRDTNLQSWIDDEDKRGINAGFNLQLGWTDIDIDADDPDFNAAIINALDRNGVDTRFSFGRRSVGVPTHVLVQLGEEESSNYEDLMKFEPDEFRLDGKRFHVQIRSYPTNTEKKNVEVAAKQTVMPGSVYMSKTKEGDYDLSVWYSGHNVVQDIRKIAQTTPRRTSFNQIVRSIAFGVFLYVVRSQWVEGSRQSTATKVAGWLARVVKDSEAMNNHEVIAKDVFCPIDSDSTAESLIEFVCDMMGDEEKHMRVRTYRDARLKLERNPDAKIPGWPAMVQLFGAQGVAALRTVFTPGSDVSVLTKMAERYAYDETDNMYIDRDRHGHNHTVYFHEPGALERRHIDETVLINGKPKPAFKMYETSKMRVRVARRDLYPDYVPGSILRLNNRGEVLTDEDDDDESFTLFNTWRGWPIAPANPVQPDLLRIVEERLDGLLGYLTCDNAAQIAWVKDWLAWTFQHPGDKQQIAWVVVGGQGVGKSFMGNQLIQALMGPLWGTTSSTIISDKFNTGPFIDKMFVFVDEAKFHNEAGTEEIKKLIRNIDNPGRLLYTEGGTYKIYARLMFASNTFDMAIGQKSIIDRALFYTRAYDAKYKEMTDAQFRAWSETLKPWFEEFAAMLKRMDVREHFVHLLMTREVDKATIESIKHSSSSDPDIVGANMRPSRRIAKYIIEDGRIIDDLSIEAPFSMAQLGARIVEVCQDLNIKPVRTDLVVAEWVEAGVLNTGGARMIFKFRHKTLMDNFGAAISQPLNALYEFTSDDEGENTEPAKRKAYKGKGKFGRF